MRYDKTKIEFYTVNDSHIAINEILKIFIFCTLSSWKKNIFAPLNHTIVMSH